MPNIQNSLDFHLFHKFYTNIIKMYNVAKSLNRKPKTIVGLSRFNK